MKTQSVNTKKRARRARKDPSSSKKNRKMSGYRTQIHYCTNCNSILDSQDGYSPDKGYWVCKECGQLLTDPNDPDFNTPSGAVWFCDGCNACLNKQLGFSESYGMWTCTECGYSNTISESEIYESEQAYQNSRLEPQESSYWSDSYESSFDNESDDDDDDDEEDDDDYSYSYSMDYDDDDDDDDDDEFPVYGGADLDSWEYKTFGEKVRYIFHCIKVCIIWAIVIACLVGVGKIAIIIDGHMNPIPIGIDSSEINQYSRDELREKLEKEGFLWISSDEQKDLTYEDVDKEGEIISVTVNGDDTFLEDDSFSRFADITIIYHGVMNAKTPISAEDAKDQEYTVISKKFQDAGFGNIELVPHYDILLGVLDKPGMLEKITVDGDKKFDEGLIYRVDTPIVITYHEKMSAKP